MANGMRWDRMRYIGKATEPAKPPKARKKGAATHIKRQPVTHVTGAAFNAIQERVDGSPGTYDAFNGIVRMVQRRTPKSAVLVELVRLNLDFRFAWDQPHDESWMEGEDTAARTTGTITGLTLGNERCAIELAFHEDGHCDRAFVKAVDEAVPVAEMRATMALDNLYKHVAARYGPGEILTLKRPSRGHAWDTGKVRIGAGLSRIDGHYEVGVYIRRD